MPLAASRLLGLINGGMSPWQTPLSIRAVPTDDPLRFGPDHVQLDGNLRQDAAQP